MIIIYGHFVTFAGFPQRHLGARPRVARLPQEQPGQDAKAEQGRADLARQRRAGAEEGAGADREGASPPTHGRGRGGLQEADRPEEGQTLGLPSLSDRRVHQPADGHGEAAQEGHAEEAEGAEEEAEAGRNGRIPGRELSDVRCSDPRQGIVDWYFITFLSNNFSATFFLETD